MRYRKLSESNDFTFGSGPNNFFKDQAEAVAQAVQTRILLWSGEWFLNLAEGTPFMQSILGKHSSITAEAALRERILNTEGVVSIASYSGTLDRFARSYSVSLKLNTVYGPTELEVNNYVNI